MEQTQKQLSKSENDEDEISEAEPKDLRDEKLSDEIDELLDEIDNVLEENAEEFVSSYIQRGGE